MCGCDDSCTEACKCNHHEWNGEPVATVVPSREALEHLKDEWLRDPCWELEEATEFQAYRDELAEFSRQEHAKWGAYAEAAMKKRLSIDPQVRIAAALERIAYSLEAWVENHP